MGMMAPRIAYQSSLQFQCNVLFAEGDDHSYANDLTSQIQVFALLNDPTVLMV